MAGTQTFEIAYDSRFLWLARLTRTGPRQSKVELDGEELCVSMGWAFRARIPRTNIVYVRRVSDTEAEGRFGSLGAHTYTPGQWTVNGSHRGWVAISIEPPAQGRSVGSRITIRELNVTVTDPDALFAALQKK